VRLRRSNVLSKGPTLADHMPSMTTFHHRAKDDGTFDSICMCCYRTVASWLEESKLAWLRGTHNFKFGFNFKPLMSPTTIPR